MGQAILDLDVLLNAGERNEVVATNAAGVVRLEYVPATLENLLDPRCARSRIERRRERSTQRSDN